MHVIVQHRHQCSLCAYCSLVLASQCDIFLLLHTASMLLLVLACLVFASKVYAEKGNSFMLSSSYFCSG